MNRFTEKRYLKLVECLAVIGFFLDFHDSWQAIFFKAIQDNLDNGSVIQVNIHSILHS